MSNLLPSTPVVENELQQLFPYPSNPQIQEWEVEARAWLVTLLMRLNAMTDDMNSCIKSMPLSQLYQWILSIQNLIRRSNQDMQGMQHLTARTPNGVLNNQADTVAVPFQGTVSSHLLKDCNIFLSKRREAFLRYELLTDLWNHLKSLLPRYKQSNK